ncbi:NUDIX domain-containing protein [Photobacterium angustum]|uniref:DNA mismatch repair protein MutT n=1 Tax=Photobacterium angustum TaxID=661 RepID=A0A2S7VIH5_PHOAN|nr:NUDIX domain-containing protein [Photobacterium angustum]PQJ61996.1 DNA mismatch repair protein MutT [Photobacterium angustum]
MHFHSTARGILINDDAVLVTRVKGDDKTFLPGGHIDAKESAATTVIRELNEEANLKVNIDCFLGAVENNWHIGQELNTELCLLFLLSSDADNNLETIKSCEAHIDYLWLKKEDLVTSNLYPLALREWLMSSQLEFTKSQPAFWGSEL